MPNEIWILIFSVLVVLAVAAFRRYKPVIGLGALLVTILACVIFAAIDVWIVGGSVFSFVATALIIYAVSNLIFQLVSKLSK